MKKLVSLFLSSVIILVLFSTSTATASSTSQFKLGDLIEFGSYPQSRVTSSELIATLNNCTGEWVSYGYTVSNKSSDFMQYIDVENNGKKYRGVRFTKYRPENSYSTYAGKGSQQEKNEFFTNNVYWFGYEPLVWKILNPTTGLIMCNTAISSMEFDKSVSSYTASAIRNFLTETFYNTAFADFEQADINLPTDSELTDKVFLLSYNDVINSEYGFGDSGIACESRNLSGSEYALCQGLSNSQSTYCSSWWLRSTLSGNICAVNYDGKANYLFEKFSTTIGVVPAMMLNLHSNYLKIHKTIHEWDVVEFGYYPQSLVTDSELVADLNECLTTWKSYKYYYSGNQTDYMQYQDFIFNGIKYRGVKFTKYRPLSVLNASPSEYDSFQYENGYQTDTVYWFSYEPLRWRVLDNSTGLVMCESVIDCREFDANNNSYQLSSIREFLNGDFYNTAFTSPQKELIHNSNIVSNDYNSYNNYMPDTTSMTDNVFLLSYSDVKNADYGFYSNETRRLQSSDYAKCLGVSCFDNYSFWLLRSAGAISTTVRNVLNNGSFIDSNSNKRTVDLTCGIVPALVLDIKSSELCKHNFEFIKTVYPTCTKDGYDYYVCSKCEKEFFDNYQLKINHDFANGICTHCGFHEDYVIIDINEDSSIDSSDLAIIVYAVLMGETESKYDINDDGCVNILDIVQVKKMLAGSV